MTTELDAAVARLKRDLDAIAAETSGAKEARGDVRLLLADWERLRSTETGAPESTANRRVAAAIAERDAARAEVERLRGHKHNPEPGSALTVAQFENLTVREWPAHYEEFAATVHALARLRERGAKVSLTLQRGLAGATTQGKRASVRLDWCAHAVKEALELLKETP